MIAAPGELPVGFPDGAWKTPTPVPEGVMLNRVTPPVMTLVFGSKMTPPSPLPVEVTGGFSCAPDSRAARTTLSVPTGAAQVTVTPVTFAAAIAPAPLAPTTHLSVPLTTWTLNAVWSASPVKEKAPPGAASDWSLPPLSFTTVAAVAPVTLPETPNVVGPGGAGGVPPPPPPPPPHDTTTPATPAETIKPITTLLTFIDVS